ncbi:MAG: nuclear transport factor 2 family protein [Pyrinomonadaceae bacterium]
MKRLLNTVLIATTAIWLSACAPAEPTNTSNRNTNGSNASNANAKPVAAAPTKEMLIDLDKKANEAFMKGDSAHFEAMLSDKFAGYEAGGKMSRADLVKMVGGTKCDVKSWSLDEPQMHQIDQDTYATIYKATFDATCDGHKVPSPTRAISLWTRSGDKWVGSFHSETLIADAKNPPKMPPPPSVADKKDEAAAPPPADPNLDALMAVERSGWEAWKARDAKKLEEITMKTLGFIGPFGDYTGNQADTIKQWTGGTCDIKSVNLSDGAATTLSPTVAILHFKGVAEGTCDGQKLLPLWGTNIYVKDGGNWKLAAGIERPAG